MDAPTVGRVQYDVAGGPLRGIGIQVIHGPSLNNVTRTCFNCSLDFVTGNFFSNTSDTWFFNPGGMITLTGGVDLNNNGIFGDAGDIPSGSTLLSGSFTGNTSVKRVSNGFNILGAGFMDTKHPGLEAFYGLPANSTYFGSLNLRFSSPGPRQVPLKARRFSAAIP